MDKQIFEIIMIIYSIFLVVAMAVLVRIQGKLKYNIDRNKVINICDLSKLYSNGGTPPNQILTPNGLRLRKQFKVGVILMFATTGILVVILSIFSQKFDFNCNERNIAHTHDSIYNKK